MNAHLKFAAMVALGLAGCAGQSTDSLKEGTAEVAGSEKVRCIEQKVLGSPARTTKICRTEAEWREQGDAARRDIQRAARPQKLQ